MSAAILLSAPVAAPAPFDAHAAGYDATFGEHPVARRWRARVWACLERIAPPGSLLLDVGSGTGIDAVELASRGREVVAAEPSARMRAEIARKLEGRADLAGRVAVRELDGARDASWEGLRELQGRVRVLCANFGAVNCLLDLGPLSRAARWLVAPGGHVVLVTMPPLCPLELAALWRPRVALRRLRSSPQAELSGSRIPIRYHGVRDLARALSPHFRLEAVEPLGLLVPAPPSRRLPEALARPLDLLEAALARVPGARAMGDHVIVTLGRQP